MPTVQVTEQTFEETVKQGIVGKVKGLDMAEVHRAAAEVRPEGLAAAKTGGA